MDPNAALKAIILAALVGDAHDLRAKTDLLADWLDHGGFRPTITALEEWMRERSDWPPQKLRCNWP